MEFLGYTNSFCFKQRLDGPSELLLLVSIAGLLGLSSIAMAYFPNRKAVHEADKADMKEHEANKKKLHDDYIKKKAEVKVIADRTSRDIDKILTKLFAFLAGKKDPSSRCLATSDPDKRSHGSRTVVCSFRHSLVFYCNAGAPKGLKGKLYQAFTSVTSLN